MINLKEKITKIMQNWNDEWGIIACDRDITEIKYFTRPTTTPKFNSKGELNVETKTSLPDIDLGYGLPEEFVKPLADQNGQISTTEVVEALGKLFEKEIQTIIKNEYKQHRPRATSKTRPDMVKPQRETVELLNEVIYKKWVC